jgi:hypothetical protein
MVFWPLNVEDVDTENKISIGIEKVKIELSEPNFQFDDLSRLAVANATETNRALRPNHLHSGYAVGCSWARLHLNLTNSKKKHPYEVVRPL